MTTSYWLLPSAAVPVVTTLSMISLLMIAGVELPFRVWVPSMLALCSSPSPLATKRTPSLAAV